MRMTCKNCGHNIDSETCKMACTWVSRNRQLDEAQESLDRFHEALKQQAQKINKDGYMQTPEGKWYKCPDTTEEI